MALRATPKRRGKAFGSAGRDSFVYRGVRIMRTWTNSKRKKKIGEAMRKVIQRGPSPASAN